MGGRSLGGACAAVLASVGLAACAEAPGGSSGGEGGRVTRVIDGDTVEMERLGKVRLIGVDTPETNRCGEDAATRFTRDRLDGEVVQYELGVDREDRYHRTLAYLSREGEMHNLALLEEGLARVLTVPPNDKYESRFEQAEREAETTDAGLWDTCDREEIRARRAAAARERREEEARRAAALARRQERRARRAAARAERRARAAASREQREEPSSSGADEPSGGGRSGGGSSDCLPQASCPGKRDGDGDGCYCE